MGVGIGTDYQGRRVMNSRQTRPDSSEESRELLARQGGHGRTDRVSAGRGRRGNGRFFVTYLFRELQRRRRQALLTGLGLAVGAGLVLTVTAASAGVQNAQATVLHSLYGVGTDVTVTKAAPPLNPGSISRSGGGGSGRFAFSPGKTPQHVDQLTETGGLGVLPASSVPSIARLPGVKAVTGGLSAIDSKSTIPSLSQLGPDGAPPASATHPASFNVDGVDPSHLGLGPFASARLSSGRSFHDADADASVAVVDSSYAAASKLTVGSMVTIAHVSFKVVGIVGQPQGSGAADVYIPLGRAQALAATPQIPSSVGKVDAIYVAAASGAAVPAVRQEIARLLPGATVTTASSLASDVTGSLASASSLISDLGRWLAGAVLIAAFVVASLLSATAVTRRVREIGTLKAFGWRTRRIVAQIIGESAVIGIVGAALGIAVGFSGAALIDALAPGLAATVSENPGSAPAENVTFGSSGSHTSIAQGAQHTVPVHLSAPVTFGAIGLTVLLALLGAIIAGSLGAWRAARLRPARAMASVA
jgi:putative ABC transport system permease protein